MSQFLIPQFPRPVPQVTFSVTLDSHSAFHPSGFVMVRRSVEMAVMKHWMCVVSQLELLIQYMWESSPKITGKWACQEEEFACPLGNPKCVSRSRICDENMHCSDGMDELSCGEFHLKDA